MKNILIICQTFPPQSDVGGVRPAMMAKYLPAFGWNPYVLTRDYGDDHPSKNELMKMDGIIEEDAVKRVKVSKQDEEQYLRHRGVFGRLRDMIQVERAFPPGVFDKMRKEALSLYDDKKIDVIWATAPGYGPLRLARDLSQRLNVPWVADFRDIPEQEMGMPMRWREWLLNKRAIVRRAQLVQAASMLTSISKYHCETLERSTGKRCALIYNGFDAENVPENSPTKTETFTITYVGRILNKWYRDPTLLFEALDELSSEGKVDLNAVQINFIGSETHLVSDIASGYESYKTVKVWDRIPHSDIPGELSGSDILLVLTNLDRPGILTTKLFEYLPVGKPILCIRSEKEGDIAGILQDTGTGMAAESVAEVKAFLEKAYTERRSGETLTTDTFESAITSFSRKNQTKCLAQCLHTVGNGPGQRCR